MPLQLPNLDDRRWADLVEEGRALIPFYAPEWTDHNLHDPGITLMELFAWFAEMNIFQLNRISESQERKFLALVGIYPNPPKPAEAVLTITLQQHVQLLKLNAGLIFEADDPANGVVRFRLLENTTFVPGELRAIQIQDATGLNDVTNRWRRGESVAAFRPEPTPGVQLYFGFTKPFPVNETVYLHFTFENPTSNEEERKRLLSELAEREEECRVKLDDVCSADSLQQAKKTENKKQLPVHPSIRIAWEILIEDGDQPHWRSLDFRKNEVIDDTCSLTFDGLVKIRIPEAMKQKKDGLYYLRCRFISADYDAVPIMRSVVFNAVLVEQAIPLGELTWIINKGVVASGSTVSAGMKSGLDFKLNHQNEITELRFTEDQYPDFLILKYKEATQTENGILMVEASRLGKGTGLPHQTFQCLASPVIRDGFKIFTREQDRWRIWELKRDFDASGMSDAHYVLDASSGTITFGDGEKGRVVPKAVPVFALFSETRAATGNVSANLIRRISHSLHNEALLGPVGSIEEQIEILSNPLPAYGGAEEEGLDHAKGRALEIMEVTTRAVTTQDYEWLARRTPGVRLARAEARSNAHPDFRCYKAPGVVQVTVLPDLPGAKPKPSKFLLRSVAAYLNRRRLLGTRVEVIGPTYVDVAVKATVQSAHGVSENLLRERIIESLNRFFHPLKGGPDGTGWPFGRDVYRSEVLQVIDETTGVQHALSLELLLNDGKPKCGNICLPSNGLVAPGTHQIEVV